MIFNYQVSVYPGHSIVIINIIHMFHIFKMFTLKHFVIYLMWFSLALPHLTTTGYENLRKLVFYASSKYEANIQFNILVEWTLMHHCSLLHIHLYIDFYWQLNIKLIHVSAWKDNKWQKRFKVYLVDTQIGSWPLD